MKKKVLGIVTIGLLGCSALFAATSELRSPNFLERGDVLHYMLEPVKPDELWSVELWGAGYCRTARRAFIPCEADDCLSNDTTSKTQELATLFFGKDCFRPEEAFAGGIVSVAGADPDLALSTICPRFSYNEKGAYIGLHAQRDICDSCWHIGGRASLPIKVINVGQERSCGSETIAEEGGLGQVVVRRQEIPDAQVTVAVGEPDPGYGDDMNIVGAYRLDFLNTLTIDGQPLVVWGDGGATPQTLIAGEPITTWASQGYDAQRSLTTAPMYAIYAQNGKITDVISVRGEPLNALGATNNLARDIAGVNLPANGGAANGTRYQFISATNYAGNLALDRDAQSKLFIIPTVQEDGGFTLTPEANLVQNAIDYAMNQDVNADFSGIAWFKRHGVDFCVSKYIAGLGDLYTEFYTGYQSCDWFLDGLLGFTFPTGKTSCDSGLEPYYQPLGNNGHFEMRLGLEGGWHPAEWFALRAMASYNQVFEHCEKRAPYFEGATIRNVPAGDPISAKVKWNYFWGNIDFSFFVPDCPDCGFTLGYEAYVKSKDKLCFCTSTAKDWVGQTSKLDECLAAQTTNTRTHKVRGEFFHRCGCCQYFLGGSWAFAGNYAMKEASVFGGVVVYF